MKNEDYIKLYKKLPTEIIDYVINDMMSVAAYSEIDYDMVSKITEWKYILVKARDKIY